MRSAWISSGKNFTCLAFRVEFTSCTVLFVEDRSFVTLVSLQVHVSVRLEFAFHLDFIEIVVIDIKMMYFDCLTRVENINLQKNLTPKR